MKKKGWVDIHPPGCVFKSIGKDEDDDDITLLCGFLRDTILDAFTNRQGVYIYDSTGHEAAVEMAVLVVKEVLGSLDSLSRDVVYILNIPPPGDVNDILKYIS